MLLGASQTVTVLIAVVSRVLVDGGRVIVTAGNEVVDVTVTVEAGRVLMMVVPAWVKVVVTGGTTEVTVVTIVVPGRVVTNPGSVVTKPGSVVT